MKFSLAVFYVVVLFLDDISAYEIILDRLEAFENDKLFKLIDLRVKKIKDNKKVVSGKVDILQSINDDYSLYVSFYNFDAGQYKKYFIEKNFTNLCTSATEDILLKDAAKDLVTRTESKIVLGKCPWPAGVLDANNYFPKDSQWPPYMSMASEKWRGDIQFYKNDEWQGGLKIYALLRNEETLMNLGR